MNGMSQVLKCSQNVVVQVGVHGRLWSPVEKNVIARMVRVSVQFDSSSCIENQKGLYPGTYGGYLSIVEIGMRC